MYLETKSLTKVFGKQTAVDNLDLAIEKGSFTAILGPNGAGKSTTIEMLLGALSPTSGSIYYQTKTTKLRGIQELRRETCMPLLLYSGSEAEAECALGYIDTGNKKGCFTGFS